MRTTTVSLGLLFLLSALAHAQQNSDSRHNIPRLATELDIKSGFQVEQLYQVPRNQGSWICMTFDPQRRLIVSTESGHLYRVKPYKLGDSPVPTQVERLDMKLGVAQGLLYFDDSLYVIDGGVVRLWDTNNDGQFDKREKLFDINGRGEHGPHTIVADPEQEWLYLIAGNGTKLPQGITRDRVSSLRGSKRHSPPSPQGWVMRFDPSGKKRELFCIGLRNSFGLAFNPRGELFTYDSDNEGFMGLPWYRPTNVYHLVSGGDYGWRQSEDNLMPYYPDNLPPTLEVGPGSPTGMVFGTNAKLPEKYQRALFVNDWSYGRIYVVHLTPSGSTYRAEEELIVSGRPLAVTTINVGPDGAIYFLTGGRGTQSAVYRMTYVGKDSTSIARKSAVQTASALRHKLSAFHGKQNDRAIALAWPELGNPDRWVRFAARTAIEHQDITKWRSLALDEKRPTAIIEAMIAMTRRGKPTDAPQVYKQLLTLKWPELTRQQQLGWLRSLDLTIQYLGEPDNVTRTQLLTTLNPLFPNLNSELNRELIRVLLALQAKSVAERTIKVLENTSTAMEQLHYLVLLDNANIKFTDEQQSQLKQVLDLETIRDTGSRPYKNVGNMIASLLKAVDAGKPKQKAAPEVKKWTRDELFAKFGNLENLKGDLRRGQAAFRKAQCHSCHRIGSTGGVLGPNLTSVGGRFKLHDVLESIIDPDKIVADQYRTTLFRKTDGKQFTGQIVNLSKGVLQIRLDPIRPFPRVSFPEKEIEEIRLLKTSLMPKNLLNVLDHDEVRNLLTFLMATQRN